MFSGAQAAFRMRFSILVLALAMLSLPGFAQQKGKNKPLPAGASDNAPIVQAAAEQSSSATTSSAATQEEGTVAQNPAEKTPAPAPARAGSARKRAEAAAKQDPAPPIQPVVPPMHEPDPAVTAVQPETPTPSTAIPHEPAAAAPVASAASVSEPNAPLASSGWMDLAKTAGGVGLVACLILGAFIGFRKFAPQYVAKRPNERMLRVVESVSLGDKKSVAIVQAGEKRFLLASTPGKVTLLTALPDPVPAPVPAAAAEPPTAAEAASGARFRNLYEMEKKSTPSRPAVRAELPPDIRGKMQQLRKALEG